MSEINKLKKIYKKQNKLYNEICSFTSQYEKSSSTRFVNLAESQSYSNLGYLRQAIELQGVKR